MSAKLLLAFVASALVGATTLASAQPRDYWQDPYSRTQDMEPPDMMLSAPYEQGPFVGTFSEGLPYGMNSFGPSDYPYGPPLQEPAPMER